MAHARLAVKRALRSVLYLINLQSLGLTLLGCIAVFACERLDWRFALDNTVVVFGVTFSVTFSITQAYQRRERALITIADLKASVIALYWMHRDWAQGSAYPGSLGDDSSDWAREFAAVATDFLVNLQAYISVDDGYESLAEMRLAAKVNSMTHLLIGNHGLHHNSLGETFIQRMENLSNSLPGRPFLVRAYAALSRMSVMNEYLTHKAGYTRGGEGGMSRTAQYLRFLVSGTEQLRMIKLYRTPTMLRHACTLLVYVLTVLLAPYFLYVGRCGQASPWKICPAPYIMSTLWVMVTMLLLSVQASNEHPLDMDGIDDVFMDISEEFNDVLKNARYEGPIDDDGSCFAAHRL